MIQEKIELKNIMNFDGYRILKGWEHIIINCCING